MPTISPDFINRVPRRLNGALKPGTVAGDSTTFEVVNVAGATAIAVRFKSTGAGTLKGHWVGPDTDFTRTASSGASVPTVFTEYTSGNPTDVTVTGGTEALLAIPPITAQYPIHSGESFLKIIFVDTSGSTNTIDYCDLACRTGAGT